MTLTQVKHFAIDLHNNCGCMYGDLPYRHHLEDVVAVAYFYLDSLYAKDHFNAVASCWLHDTIEDCRLTYSNVKEMFGEIIADCVYNVTNEMGKTRKERAEKTYPKIAGHEMSTFVKLCDRIANTYFSKHEGSSMYDKYCREYKDFKQSLQLDGDLVPLWKELDEISGVSEKDTIHTGVSGILKQRYEAVRKI